MTEETYSDALRRLEAIVAELERGGMDLETTLERFEEGSKLLERCQNCLLYTSPSPRDQRGSRMPSSA